MGQYAFYFDQTRCYGCQTCAVTCKDWNLLETGPEQWMSIYDFEEGVYPNIRLNILAFSCGHCDNPVCVPACPNDAIFKEDKYGAVLVDQDKCDGCRSCYDACPYGSPSFKNDEAGTKMSKCTMCIDKLENGEIPACVSSCPLRALDFGPVEEMEAKYGSLRQLKGMPDASLTNPNYIVKAKEEKVPLIPFDAKKHLELNGPRGEFVNNPVVKNITDITEYDPANITPRTSEKFSMKFATAAERFEQSKNDIG